MSDTPTIRLSDRRLAVRRIHARFDSAATTPDNKRHWANADALSADAAANPSARAFLRMRARYEVANNSYARGIVLTIANDVVGTGPRLQMLGQAKAVNDAVEKTFRDWACEVDLAEKLRTLRMTRCESGEGFGLLVTNPALYSPVKLDVRLVESDQVQTPAFGAMPILPGQWVDGIVFDQWHNPVEYHILRQHPGDVGLALLLGTEYDKWPAGQVLHYYRADRPGQKRGIPDLTPALPLFAQLRRYTLAVIAAAETAADYAAVIYSDAPGDADAAAVDPMDTFELEKRMATVLPQGWKLGQMSAEQPTTTYGDFKDQILNEIARCLNMPFNIAAGNSSKYNYSSGRLDHQVYFKAIRIDQAEMVRRVLDPLFDAWLTEAIRIPGYLPAEAAALAEFPRTWFWDGAEHVDPLKEAAAQAQRLASNTTTLAQEFARSGQDWESQIRQRAKEVALLKELGLAPEQAAPKPMPPAPPPGPTTAPKDTTETDDEPDEEDAADE